MEHLRMPKGAKLTEDDIVPCVASTDYLGTLFLEYPQVKGFHHVVPRAGFLNFARYEGIHPTPDDKLASFLQTWLFFGTLQEVLGSLYHHEDFVCNHESKEGLIEVLSTAKLSLLLDNRFPVTTATDEDHTSLISHLHECIDLAWETSTVAASRLSRKAAFSILATMETLSSTFNSYFNSYLTEAFPFKLGWMTELPKDHWIEQMCLNGWCAREAKIAVESFDSAQALHYLSKMNKNYKDDGHRKCTRQECTGMQIDLTKYKPRHCHRSCNCAILSVDSKLLNSILEDGKFPLVRVETEDSTGELKVELVESTNDTYYIALSHVWADGLGNPFGNALPQCQLLDLQSLAQDVVGITGSDAPALLWLDTLCVPCEPGPGKNIAMAMMRRTYQEANHVLVLESSLRCCDIGSSDLVEAGVRIFTSPWLRRLWTLQEGALARRLWFQFQNRYVEMAEIFAACRADFHSRNFTQKELFLDVMTNHRLLRLFVSDNGSQRPLTTPRTVATILRSIRYRGVSVASDEPICLANLLDVDASVLTGPDRSPMCRFWRTLCESQQVPRYILFFEGPKLQDKGFRWAPATLLGAKKILPILSPEDHAPPPFNPDGLVVRFPGILISRPVSDTIPLVFNTRDGLIDLWHLFDHKKDVWYGLALKNADVQTCIYGEEGDGSSQARMLSQVNVYGIMLSHEPNAPQNKLRTKSDPRALFVSLKPHDDGMYHAHIEGEVLFITRNSGECSIYNRAMEIAQRIPRLELKEAILQVSEVEDAKKAEVLTPIVQTLIAKATQAAEEALQDLAFKSIYDSHFPLGSGTAYLILTIWQLYKQRLILINEWLPDGTLWCMD